MEACDGLRGRTTTRGTNEHTKKTPPPKGRLTKPLGKGQGAAERVPHCEAHTFRKLNQGGHFGGVRWTTRENHHQMEFTIPTIGLAFVNQEALPCWSFPRMERGGLIVEQPVV